jgi:hypothetical protein
MDNNEFNEKLAAKAELLLKLKESENRVKSDDDWMTEEEVKAKLEIDETK